VAVEVLEGALVYVGVVAVEVGGGVVVVVAALVLVLAGTEAAVQHAGQELASVEEEQVARAPRFVNTNGLHVG
jgi:hypothetical protein